MAREVGTEGQLGGQAQVPRVAGTWKDLTDNVNFMASNLTGQVRNIADVTTAVAKGDLSRKITVEARGEMLELKNTINTMVDQLSCVRVGSDARGARSGNRRKARRTGEVPGVGGTWKDLTDNVNTLAGNLTSQVRNIADVTTAVAKGDLSQKITVEVQGEILELKNTINTMVDQLSTFASEVTRVAKEVGTEGKLGGQAEVPGVGGTWKDLTDNVNAMAVEPHRPDSKHRRRDDRSREGRPLAARSPSTCKGEILELKQHDQRHGGSAQHLRRRSNTRREGSGYGRKARRPGRSARTSPERGRISPTT